MNTNKDRKNNDLRNSKYYLPGLHPFAHITEHHAGFLTKLGQINAQLRANNQIYEAEMQRILRKSINIFGKENL